MFTTLRWLTILPMSIAAWFIAFIGTVQLLDLILYFCPVEHQVSGMCTHPVATGAENALIVFGASLSAVLVILAAAFTAPTHKAKVAAGILVLGLVVAVWAYLETDALAALIGACLAGFITFLLVLRKNRWRRASGFRQYELFI